MSKAFPERKIKRKTALWFLIGVWGVPLISMGLFSVVPFLNPVFFMGIVVFGIYTVWGKMYGLWYHDLICLVPNEDKVKYMHEARLRWFMLCGLLAFPFFISPFLNEEVPIGFLFSVYSAFFLVVGILLRRVFKLYSQAERERGLLPKDGLKVAILFLFIPVTIFVLERHLDKLANMSRVES